MLGYGLQWHNLTKDLAPLFVLFFFIAGTLTVRIKNYKNMRFVIFKYSEIICQVKMGHTLSLSGTRSPPLLYWGPGENTHIDTNKPGS